jgi:D-alanyl-D-alanine dipeptidase
MVDITLVDANNRELDMGTPFDFFFWEEAMPKLSDEVINNRIVLKNDCHAFDSFDSEWWHYN